jgi:hypothetical protein
VVVLDAGCGVSIIGNSIAVLTQQLHAVGKLAQNGRHFSVLHDLVFSRSLARAKMASSIGMVS